MPRSTLIDPDKVRRSPAKRTKLVSLETAAPPPPPPPPNEPKFALQLQLSDESVYKIPFEAQSAIFFRKPYPPNEFCSFHWASANFSNGPKIVAAQVDNGSFRYACARICINWLVARAVQHRRDRSLLIDSGCQNVTKSIAGQSAPGRRVYWYLIQTQIENERRAEAHLGI